MDPRDEPTTRLGDPAHVVLERPGIRLTQHRQQHEQNERRGEKDEWRGGADPAEARTKTGVSPAAAAAVDDDGQNDPGVRPAPPAVTMANSPRRFRDQHPS